MVVMTPVQVCDASLWRPGEGPQRALGVASSSAYALTPDAARWLLQRREERPHQNVESYLMMLDGQTFEKIAVAPLPEIVPMSIHGTWVPEIV